MKQILILTAVATLSLTGHARTTQGRASHPVDSQTAQTIKDSQRGPIQLCPISASPSVDTLIGAFYISPDDQAFVVTDKCDSILLNFKRICPIVGDGEQVVLIGSRDQSCPADRRFSESFTVLTSQRHDEVATGVQVAANRSVNNEPKICISCVDIGR